jgi:transcriptional regulator with XRE-family HTH domain
VPNTFGFRLAAERKRLGFTQKAVGLLLGIGRSAVGMIETDQASLDAQRLANLGSEGFDVLYVLSGEPGGVAAGRLVDWELCVQITQRVDTWARGRGIVLAEEKKALVVKHLYLQLAARGQMDDSAVAETLSMAA